MPFPTAKEVGDIITRIVDKHKNKQNPLRFDHIKILETLNKLLDQRLAAKTPGFDDKTVAELKLGTLFWVKENIASSYENASFLYRIGQVLGFLSRKGKKRFYLTGSDVLGDIDNELEQLKKLYPDYLGATEDTKLNSASVNAATEFTYLNKFKRMVVANEDKIDQLKFFTPKTLRVGIDETIAATNQKQQPFVQRVVNSATRTANTKIAFEDAPFHYIQAYRTERQKTDVTNRRFLNQIEQCMQSITKCLPEEGADEDESKEDSQVNLILRGALFCFIAMTDPATHPELEKDNILYKALLQAANLDGLNQISPFDFLRCLSEFSSFLYAELAHKKLQEAWKDLYEAEKFLIKLIEEIDAIKAEVKKESTKPSWSFEAWTQAKLLTVSASISLGATKLTTKAAKHALSYLGPVGKAADIGIDVLFYLWTSWFPGILSDPNGALVKKLSGTNPDKLEQFLQTEQKFPDIEKNLHIPLDWIVWMLAAPEELVPSEIKNRLLRIFEPQEYLLAATTAQERNDIEKIAALQKEQQSTLKRPPKIVAEDAKDAKDSKNAKDVKSTPEDEMVEEDDVEEDDDWAVIANPNNAFVVVPREHAPFNPNYAPVSAASASAAAAEPKPKKASASAAASALMANSIMAQPPPVAAAPKPPQPAATPVRHFVIRG